MTTLQELYPEEYKPEEEKKKKRGRPKKHLQVKQQQQGVPFQGVDVVDRTGVEDPLESTSRNL